ncbi:hypothetical protein GMJAKD_11695 [Candidatus Electrothrix aarhusensis]
MYSLDIYKKIFSLKENIDHQKRGYLFEQLLRESLPWTSRPPIAISTKTEQLDGFFEWNTWHFLLEAKAKHNVITAGSHDWEDFALKVRKRAGQCIGLFCSLYDVNKEVLNEADLLNKSGLITILVAGSDWEHLAENQIPLHEYLRYMIFQAKAKQTSRPESFKIIREWVYNRENASRIIRANCLKSSSIFLRRHRIVRHEQVYVSRTIDENISEFSRLICPSRTSNQDKEYTHGGKSFIGKRTIPKQICVVRDLSGAGKTTLAAEVANEIKKYFGCAKAALQNDIDNIDFLPDDDEGAFGIKHLIACDKPIIYVIDSLDEASMIPGKHKEIKSLFKLLIQLNKVAQKMGLACFPIGLIFTIREDFWRDWESSFEGAHSNIYIKRFSNFTPQQINIAIENYSKAYSFHLSKPLNKQSLKVLSHPFNLQIFAEANEYRGEIVHDEILNENVLSLYFERKQEDVLKRPIVGFTPSMLIPICSVLAVYAVSQKRNSIDHTIIYDKIFKLYPMLNNSIDSIIQTIVSEQIIVRDQNNISKYRFRHMRFIEYLVAYYISDHLFKTKNPKILDELTSKLITGDFISLYYVHEFVRFICKMQFPELYVMLTSFYAQSSDYMNKLIRHRRAEIATGEPTTSLDMDAIDQATAIGDPVICWEGFFVLAAKHNHQDSGRLVSAFVKAWYKNPAKHDRWKLLYKLSQHNLLLTEEVVEILITSENSKDWFVFIDGIIACKQFTQFKDIWIEINGKDIVTTLNAREGEGWKRVITYIDFLLDGKGYNIGEL